MAWVVNKPLFFVNYMIIKRILGNLIPQKDVVIIDIQQAHIVHHILLNDFHD